MQLNLTISTACTCLDNTYTISSTTFYSIWDCYTIHKIHNVSKIHSLY